MTNIVTRLREHAALHADLAQHSEESAQWARDLYAAADELSKPAHEREPPHCPTCSCGSSPEPSGEHHCETCQCPEIEAAGLPQEHLCIRHGKFVNVSGRCPDCNR